MKNFIIFGDSYSTFRGYIPKGYGPYYSEDETERTDVRHVEETWWHQLMTESGANLVLNDSWSGSTICYTGYENRDCSTSSSFIYRLNKLIDSGFFNENEIDTVLVFGGTNDSWAGAPVGTLQYSAWKKEDLHAVLPAVCCFIDKLKETLPQARIIVIINSGLKGEITDGMKEACEHYGVESLQLVNVDKSHSHPTVQGMKDIREQVAAKIG